MNGGKVNSQLNWVNYKRKKGNYVYKDSIPHFNKDRVACFTEITYFTSRLSFSIRYTFMSYSVHL